MRINKINRTDEHSSLSFFLVGFLSLILAFPLFMYVHRQLPDYGWPFRTDRILMFIFLAAFVLMVLRLFRSVIIAAVIVTAGLLTYGSFSGYYGFKNLVTDYKAMLYAFKYEPYHDKTTYYGDGVIHFKKEILNAVNDNMPEVRDLAVTAANGSFRDEQGRYEWYRTTIQCFAVFKKINSNWNYISDPQDDEYFAKACESARLLAGDCDDHAILMAAAIKSIGGTPRLVHTTNHLYPEILIGNKNELEMVNYLIKKILFPAESRGQEIHYHKDEEGNIWLNLDYTANYPGGKFFAEPVLGVLVP